MRVVHEQYILLTYFRFVPTNMGFTLEEIKMLNSLIFLLYEANPEKKVPKIRTSPVFFPAANEFCLRSELWEEGLPMLCICEIEGGG